MKRPWKRITRLALMTLGFAGLFVAVSAVPGTATPADPVGSFRSVIQARGTNTTPGTIPISQGLDIVVARNEVDPGGRAVAVVVVCEGLLVEVEHHRQPRLARAAGVRVDGGRAASGRR